MKLFMKSQSLLVFLFSAAVLLGSLFTIGFAGPTSNVSVNVTVASFSQITVTPDALNWTSVNPGTVAVPTYNLTIANTGSANVTAIFAYANTNETETSRPYGSDNPALFSSGGSLVMRNNTDARYYWVQRKEWNWTNTIPNTDYSGFTAPANVTSYGFIRNTSQDYLWAVAKGGVNSCNDTSTEFGVEDDIDVGTTATRTPTITSITRSGGDAFYSYFRVDRATAPVNTSCVAVRHDCSYILLYKWDRRSNFGAQCTGAAGARDVKTLLTPGSTDTVYAQAWIPLGIPAGQLAVARLTFEGT